MDVKRRVARSQSAEVARGQAPGTPFAALGAVTLVIAMVAAVVIAVALVVWVYG